jgi:uncharacterized membrane protein
MTGVDRTEIEQREPEGGTALDRLIFFSDAIFAISITLLVLPLAETHIDQARAPEELHELLPEIWTFVLSFVVIGVFWMQHHRYFRDIAAFDGGLIRLNFAFLLCIVFMPFPTAALARAGGSPAVVALYAGTIVATSSMSTLMWWYASRPGSGLLADGVPRARVRHRLLGVASAISVFLVSIPVALIDADAGKYTWIAAFPVSVLVERWQRRREP